MVYIEQFLLNKLHIHMHSIEFGRLIPDCILSIPIFAERDDRPETSSSSIARGERGRSLRFAEGDRYLDFFIGRLREW